MKKILKKSKNKPACRTKLQKKKELRNKRKIISKIEKSNKDWCRGLGRTKIT